MERTSPNITTPNKEAVTGSTIAMIEATDADVFFKPSTYK